MFHAAPVGRPGKVRQTCVWLQRPTAVSVSHGHVYSAVACTVHWREQSSGVYSTVACAMQWHVSAVACAVQWRVQCSGVCCSVTSAVL